MPNKETNMNKIEQVKLLLFGETIQEIDERIRHLEDLVESNSRSFEKALLETKTELLTQIETVNNQLIKTINNLNTEKSEKIIDLEKLAKTNAVELETKLTTMQKDLLSKINLNQKGITNSLNNLNVKKAERKDVDKAFETMRKAFEEISKVL